jgi:predicted pyridoxine 5'-phosphate oxidase superfamily flavin-nucleotide-binding protein
MTSSEHEQSRYHEGSRSLQDRFDTRALADRIDDLLVSDTINEHDRAFIEARDMFFLASADADGRPTCSYKGGEPGFVRVLDPQTLAFPIYDGNGMYLSTGNVLANPHVGMLFIDFEQGNRMRLEGEASVDPDDPLVGDYPEAQLVVRVRARAVYPNCPRYIHRYELVRRSRFVPRSDCATPVPQWKRSDWAFDALPADDPARNPGDREVLGR